MDLKPPVNSDPRRGLPSVDRLSRALTLQHPEIPRWAAIEGARRAVESARADFAKADEKDRIRDESPEGDEKVKGAMDISPEWLAKARGEPGGTERFLDIHRMLVQVDTVNLVELFCQVQERNAAPVTDIEHATSAGQQ